MSFSVRPGEILGLFGLVGAGRTELAQAIFGVWPGEVEGAVLIDGREARPRSAREAIDAGLGMLTENRKQTGLMEGQSVTSNISAASIDAVSGPLFVDRSKETVRNGGLVRSLDVRPPDLEAPVESFSSLTVSSPEFVTQTWVPSEETASGPFPTAMVWTTVPVEASSSLTVPSPSFATQTWVPSEETPSGSLPTAMVWTTAPVEASSSLTVSSLEFATQTWVPSEETPSG